MSNPERLPLPDVPRLVKKARAGGPYLDEKSGALRSPLERYTVLYRALEQLARFNDKEVEQTLAVGFACGRSKEIGQALQAFAKEIHGLSPHWLASLVDEKITGVSRDAAASSLRSAAKGLMTGKFLPRDERMCRDATRLVRGLRNAAVHAKVMTTDQSVFKVFGVACVLLDELVIASYQGHFTLGEEEISAALA